jgi:hypothetical protein
LVDARGQGAHGGDPVGDLLAEQHPAAAWLGALPEDHLDRVRLAQVRRVHPVAGGQVLVDEVLGLPALLRGHATVAGGGRRADLAGTPPQRLLRLRGQGAEAHPRDRHRDVEVQRAARVAVAEHHVGVATLAVALQGIAGHGRAEEQQVVEVRHAALRAPAADVVDAGVGGVLDGGDGGAVERRRLAERVESVLVTQGWIDHRIPQYVLCTAKW